jgi:Notch-like protein
MKYNVFCSTHDTGTLCEINIDECASSPCQNGATCEDKINSYRCNCAPGYTGTHCETEIDECALYQPCQHGGTCTDLIANYSCACPAFRRFE